jgi:methylmalonyl-CoA/ethylmalonyl-CoA epimerase
MLASTAVPGVVGIKHMAFAVRDAHEALAAYAGLIGVPGDAEVIDYPKSRTRVALFRLGGIEYQLCQSLDADGRFAAWIAERGTEGLHHVCYEVSSIDAALRHAMDHGATLRPCKACGIAGSHPHPEGHVAFLDQEVGGLEVEFMQVYTPDERTRFERVQGI